jgi:hypothetical protein
MRSAFDSRLNQGWWALRVGLGVGPVLAGLDKYFNFLTNWPTYLSPLALRTLPFSGPTFMHIVGLIEMLALYSDSPREESATCSCRLMGTRAHLHLLT